MIVSTYIFVRPHIPLGHEDQFALVSSVNNIYPFLFKS